MLLNEGGAPADHRPDLAPDLPGVPSVGLTRRTFRRVTVTGSTTRSRPVLEEVPVAIAYNGIGYAVLMVTPCDLEDFALGFSLSEGIVAQAGEVLDCAVTPAATVTAGYTIDVTITARRAAGIADRRRTMIGPSGCGLCGAETLAVALRPLPMVGRPPSSVRAAAIHRALAGLSAVQPLNRETGAAHAAAWFDQTGTIIAVREDVGRHNALDKLIGGEVRSGHGWCDGFLVLTSRCSYELVAKAVTMGIDFMVTISAPTSLALDYAARYGVCLVGVARADGMQVYTMPERVVTDQNEDA